jgi:hypothetical protein
MHKSLLLKSSIILIVIFSVISVTYGWKLVVQGRVQETFDDNIHSTIETRRNLFQFLTNPLSTFISSRDIKRWDFITEPMFGLGVQHEGKTYMLNIIGHIYARIYNQYYQLSNYYEDATLNLTKAFSDQISFQVTNVFQNYPEPARFEVLSGNMLGRMQYLRNNVNCMGLFEVNPHYMIRLEYTNQYTIYYYTHTGTSRANDMYRGTPLNQNLKHSIMHDAQMRHEIHWDSANNTYLFYEYEWINQSPVGIPKVYSPSIVSMVHRPGIGYRHDFTKQLYIEGRVAPDIVFPSHVIRISVTAYGGRLIIPPSIHYPYLQYYNNIQPPGLYLWVNEKTREITPYYISFYAYLTLSNDVDEKTNARLTFTYMDRILDNAADTISSWEIVGDMTRYILPRLSLTASVFYGQGSYYAQRTTNRLFGFNISFAYDIVEYVSAFVTYDFTLNYNHVDGYRVPLVHNLVWDNGAYMLENSGYLRHRATIGVRAEY